MTARLHAQSRGRLEEFAETFESPAGEKSKPAARSNPVAPPPIVGQSDKTQRLRQQIARLSSATCNVLIQGESGAGKELVARHLHAGGKLARQPFIPVDCSALCETLFESQLFGHVKGSFTGADRATLGFFRAADGGTLFLDEIGELGLQMQAKLLRCIQEKAVIPVGADHAVPVRVRIIAATNRDLRQMVAAGTFREDLFYRLHVVCLRVPPLRARRDDIPALTTELLTSMAQLYEQAPRQLTVEAAAALQRYDWPGNVRELANAIEYLYAMHSQPRITAAQLPAHIVGDRPPAAPGDMPHVVPLHIVERNAVRDALRHTDGNQAQAARLLEIDARRLYRMVRRYELQELVHQSRPADPA